MSSAQAKNSWKIARSFPRFAILMPVTVFSARLGLSLASSAVDIGLGGICITLPSAQIESNERVTIEFTFPERAGKLRLLAKVRYIVGERHGLQFLSITPEQRETIRHACEKLTIV